MEKFWLILLSFLVPVIICVSAADKTAIVKEEKEPPLVVRSSLPSYPSSMSSVRSSREVLESKRNEDGENEVNNNSSAPPLRPQNDGDATSPRKDHADFCTMDGLFCVPANYSKYVPPIETTKVNATVISKKVKVVRPLDVSIGFDNFEILKIDDRDFSVEINAYLIVKWKDSRIIIDYDQLGLYDENSEIPEWIPVELELVTKIWLPDSEILRLKGFHSLSVLDRLQGLWISVTHEVLYVVATRIKFMCPMAMSKFPMDVQWCKFQIGSFNYDNTKMRYITYYLPTLPDSTESILDFEVKIHELLPSEQYYLPQETGNYSVAGFRMVMARKVSHYVITYYIPSGLFVVVSWASFLIPCDDIQGRMALLVTLFLVLVNIFNAITTNSPKADGLNALQAWIITCIFFVFGALLEYSIILLRLKIYSLSKRRPTNVTSGSTVPSTPNGPKKSAGINNSSSPALMSPIPQPAASNRGDNYNLVGPCSADGAAAANLIGIMRQNQSVARLDLVCLVVFPMVFLVFAVVYWICIAVL